MAEESELSERPPQDREQVELEDATASAIRRYGLSERDALTAATAALNQVQATLELKLFQSPALNDAWTQVRSNANEDFGSADGPTTELLKRMQTRANDILARADSMNLREYNLRRFFAGVLGMDVVPAALAPTFQAMRERVLDGSRVPSSVLPKPALDAVVAAADVVGREADVYFWDRVSKYADANDLTAVDLLYFMQYVQQLFPLKAPFLWYTEMAKTGIVDGMVSAGTRNGAVDPKSLASSLRSPPQMPDGSLYPRAVVASCAQLAFAALASKAR
jgi:hypothetical protein